ncbi:Thioredoxin [Rickettsiales endosymbiont of Paramecium tredecaurelia]|uniref:thioredoxin n=1 Tax=Candidatus Sarmatiella mevalonica TaxID=2770581 RepID=UPI0019221AB6|nr:thioredoxin [Candidatus Sarmatiella mevalonica]MBL3284861.1 Thioredoxin [Candidatus Sarmatiella mevalonica]
MVLSVTDSNFQQEVLDSEALVLVDFWAEWCGPCKMFGPILEEVSNLLSDKIKICKMDIDANPNTPTAFAIRSIPTIMLFRNGEAVSTKTGLMQKDSLIAWIEEYQ